MTQKLRLSALSHSLTPQQGFLLWLEETLRFPSLPAWLASLARQPETAHPLVFLPSVAGVATRRALRGRPREEVEVGVRKAERDLLFLYFLWQEVNALVLGELEEQRLRFQVLREKMRLLLFARGIARQLRRQERVRLLSSYPLDEAGLRREAEELGTTAEETILALFSLLAVPALLSAEYFNGAVLLFPAVTEFLACLEQAAATVSRTLHGDAELAGGADVSRSLAELRPQAEAAAQSRSSYLADLARADVMKHAGNQWAGEEYVRPYLPA